nr:Gfo/Idh/MocA family oxidoreductase [uncultured Schaedlerella sp.]
MKKVITYGTYDLFHEGHYNLLKRAKALGDYLIVGVTTEYYDLQRGKLNVVDPVLKRVENVRKTGLADEIIIEDHDGQKPEDIQKMNIDIFAIGSDWVGAFDYLKEFCEVIYLDRTPDISSSILRESKYPVLQLGIVGSGRIAPRFLSEAKFVSGINARAVYNPNEKSAGDFGRLHELEAYSGKFSSFLKNVDAIYIASPHETHYHYAKEAIEHGIHVLCEKPLTFTVREAEELYALAEENGIILMEGIKTAYCPGFMQMMNIARNGVIGEVRDIEACFSRITPAEMREMRDEQYGGAFLEFGSYTLLPIFKLLGCNYESVEFDSISAENGIDLYTKIHFRFKNALAMSKTGIGVKSEGQLVIAGTKGYILAESPWWLTRSFEVRFEDPNRIEKYSPKFLGDGLRYEIADFVSKINGNEKMSHCLTREESVAMAGVVERFMEERRNEHLKGGVF